MSSLEDKVKAAGIGLNEDHHQKQLQLASTQRHIILSYPRDLTDEELLDFLGYLTHQFRSELPPMPRPSGRLMT